MIKDKVKLYVRHFYRFCRCTLSTMRHASASCMSSSETVSLAYAYWRSVSVGDAGRGIPTMVVLCTSISLLKKSRLCMYKEGNVYFWKKRIVCKSPLLLSLPFTVRSLHETPYNDYPHYMTCILNLVNVSLV